MDRDKQNEVCSDIMEYFSLIFLCSNSENEGLSYLLHSLIAPDFILFQGYHHSIVMHQNNWCGAYALPA